MAATDLCFPVAQGVPGQYWGQGPQWWTPGPASALTQLDDPRWRGAVNRSFDNGTGLEAAMRGIYHSDGGQNYLMLSFQVYTDPDADGLADMVWLGLQRGGHGSGAPAYIIEMHSPAVVAAHEDSAAPVPSWGTIPDTGGQKTALTLPAPHTPPELEARHWLTLPSPAANSYSWALNLRIPLRSGGEIDETGLNLGNVGDTFAFWFTIIVDHGQVDPNDASAFIAVPYTFPRLNAGLTGSHLNPVFPQTDHWATAKLGGAACGSGISLAGSDITANGGTNTIHAVPGATTTNHFKVRPFNNGITAGVDANALQATLRIANWGSQTPIDKAPAGQTDWQEIPFSGTPPAAPTSAGNVHPKNLVAIPNMGHGDLDFDWPIDANTAKYWTDPNPIFAPHQCVFAQLKEVGGPGYDFINDSAYNNMNVVPTASPAISAAEFSVKGRPTTVKGGASQKLYVFVQRSAAARPMTAAQYKQLLLKERQQPREPVAPRPAIQPETELTRVSQPMSDALRAAEPVSIAQPLATRMLAATSHAQIEQPAVARLAGIDLGRILQVLPTFKYHAYYSTGIKIRTTPKRIVTLYDPQTSFGYVVAHQGPQFGWSHALTPAAVRRKGVVALKQQAAPIANDRFAIDIPHGGAVVAYAVITPVLRPPKLDPIWLNWFRRLTSPLTRITGR
jgi:hypothetical protein